MVCRRNHFYHYYIIVNFIYQSVFLIESSRPSLFEWVMLQLFGLPCAKARIFCNFNKQVLNLFYQRFVTAFGKLFNLLIHTFCGLYTV